MRSGSSSTSVNSGLPGFTHSPGDTSRSVTMPLNGA
jgi:hypothetical protein